uniref:polynucleotide adenylyltransferase n=1 Tax=Dracunculus medinensis TaxID=318479 RepID=A0A0N4ULF2_DRAME
LVVNQFTMIFFQFLVFHSITLFIFTFTASTKLNSIRSPPLLAFGNNGNFEVSKMDVLSEEIWHYHNIVTQSESVLNKKLHLRDMLYYSISPVFPMCGLYVVGSSLNGFGNNSSDMDLCLMITNQDLDQQTDAVLILNMVQNAIMELKWIRQQQLICAKVPILRIKFSEPFQDITVDLNVNNSVAIRNTHLLCFYSSFDWRVRPLVTVVKEWAKRHDINDANRSSFTSYSLVLMVIHYLQCGTEPRILPSLQEMYPDRFNPENDVRALNVSSPLEPPSSNEWQFTDTTTLGELLIGFLDYYAYHFDYLRDAISVRLGKKTERALVARQHSPYNTNNIAQWNCICIEEPFTLSNTAHSVHNQVVFDAIRKAFCESHKELDRNRDLKAFLNAKPIKIPLCNPFGFIYYSLSFYKLLLDYSVSSVSSTSDNGRDIEHSSDETATNSRSSITSCAESGNETNMISSNEFESADLKKTLFLKYLFFNICL